jgi:hypothetical protein
MNAPTLALCLLLAALGCRKGPCPPDTELRGGPQARQQSCEYQDSNGLSVKHGPFVEWDAEGRKRTEGSYRNGKQEGRWTYWDESGRRTMEREYHDGAVVTELKS